MNNKIIGYTIIKGLYHEEVVRKVTELLKENWQPVGGVAVTGLYCLQAMIKYEK